MSSVKVLSLDPAHLDTPAAKPWPQNKQTQENLPTVHPIVKTDNTALSYSFDSIEQALRIELTDQNSGEVLRHIEFKSFPASLHRAEKLSGLLLDIQA